MSGVAEIALFTDDVEATVAFYRVVLDSEPVSEWPGGALFAADAVKVLVHARAPAAEDGPPNEDHVAVSVADVDASCAVLREHGLAILVEPRDFPWGHSAYLRDPDGRLVELAQP